MHETHAQNARHLPLSKRALKPELIGAKKPPQFDWPDFVFY